MSTESNDIAVGSKTSHMNEINMPQISERQRSQTNSHGESTPHAGHGNCSFVPSDISSVAASSSSAASSLRKRYRSPKRIHIIQNIKVADARLSNKSTLPKQTRLEEILDVSTMTPNRNTIIQNDTVTEAKLSNGSELRKQTRLEQIVNQRLQSFQTSISKALQTVHPNRLESSSDSDSTDVEPPPRKKYKAYKGNDWKLFKPIREDRIYAKILQCFADGHTEASKWVQEFVENPEEAITNMIQFLVDVCGHQELDVAMIFKCEKVNLLEVINYMQKNPPDNQQNTGKYLMKVTSGWGRQIHNVIYQFIENLLELSNSKEILDNVTMTHLFGFVAALSMSNHKPLLHTGVVIAARMTTVLVKICLEIGNKLQHYSNVAEMDMAERLELWSMKKNNVHKILTLFQTIIEKQCCHPDPSLYSMKIVCIEQMWKWFEADPGIISSSKYFRKLMRLVKDVSKPVRVAALATCYKLVETNKFLEYIDPYMDKFIEAVRGRVYDVDFSVAISAVRIFTALIYTYPNALTPNVLGNIPLLIYGNHYPLAAAAGKFFISYISSDIQTNRNELLLQLITFVNKPQKQDYIPLLVEALLDCCPELCNWKMMIYLLLSDMLDYESETTLVHIMSQAVQQTVTGTAKICRIKSAKRQVIPQDVKNISEIFLVKLHPLLKKYLNDAKCLEMLTEILMVIDLEHSSIAKHATALDDILSVLRPAFVRNIEPAILETISKVFARLCHADFVLKNLYIGRVLTVKQAVVDSINNFIDDLNQDKNLSEDDLYSTELSLLRLSVLFTYHDMTEVMENGLLFNNLMTLDDKIFTPNSLKYVITSGYWFLIWQLRQIIEKITQSEVDYVLQQRINQIKSTTLLYKNMCVEFMTNSENVLVRNEAFTCLCNLLLEFRRELKNFLKHNPVLAELIPNMEDSIQVTKLMDFAQELLFQDSARQTLKLRRLSMGNIINLVLSNVINVLELIKLYKHYYTHNEDYRDIFDGGLKNLRETGVLTFTSIVLRTLLHCYKSFSAVADEILKPSEETDNLRKLVKQFQIFVGRSTAQLNLILQLGIKYSVFSEDRYSFLDFLKYFSVPLPTEEKQQILQFLITRLPEKDKNNNIVTNFIRYVEQKSLADCMVRRKLLADASTTLESEEEAIEEDITALDFSECTGSYAIEESYSDA